MNLWHGGTIYTMQKEGHTVEAILEHDGIILEIGSVKDLQDRATHFIDLQGDVLYPGFVDSHLHIIGYGEKLKNVDVSMIQTKEQLLERLQEEAALLSEDDWLVAIGYNEGQNKLATFPTLEEIDELGCHVVIKRSCHHLIMVNHKALKYANISDQSENPSGGIIEKKNGKLTGILKDNALYLVVNNLPTTTQSYVDDALEKSIQSLHSYGLVGGHSEDLSYYGHPSVPLKSYQKVVQKRNFKAHLLQHHAAWDDLRKIQFTPSTWVELGAMKIFVDGALGGRTAALCEPYTDDRDNKGMFIHTKQTLKELVQQARADKTNVAVHVIGDAAISCILDVFEEFPPIEGQKDRIIHCSLVNEQILERLSTMPVIIDMQPQFIQSDIGILEGRLGSERLRFAHSLKSFLQRNIIVAGGSDAPIETPNPLYGIYAAITRKAFDSSIALNESECISRYEAVSLYTTEPAKVIGKDKVRGQIAAGFEADFTIFNDDIFAVQVDQIPHLHVTKTVVHGQIIYDFN